MKFHPIGICGTGMGSLAGLLNAQGHEVKGSDRQAYPPMSVQLKAVDIEIMSGFAPENLRWEPDVVVVGNICRKDHVEVAEAKRHDIKMTSMAALLSERFLAERRSVVVAGTHGKTTCAALAAHLLEHCGLDPSFFIGGVPLNFGRTFRLGNGEAFVVEGDEYDTAFFDKKSKFLHYRPKVVLLTGVEFDHADIFGSLSDIHQAFAEFMALIPDDGLAVVHRSVPKHVLADCRSTVHFYGLASESEPAGGMESLWTGEIVEYRDPGITRFRINGPETSLGPFDLNMSGKHNLLNAVGCLVAAHHLGLDEQSLAGALPRFLGVKRRQEVVGVAMGVTVVDDFAHHPTAVYETLKGLRGRHGKRRLIAVFEPRSATSRRALFQERYADALAAADEVALAPVYNAEALEEAERLDSARLAADIRSRGTPARHFEDIKSIIEHLSTRVRPGDTVVIMSSGAFGDIHKRLLRRIGDAITPASLCDVEELDHFLDRMGLHAEKLASQIDSFVILRGKAGLVGCIGMEIRGDCGLLKDLAVVPERRGEGLGWMLAQAALDRARSLKLRRVYMFGIPTTEEIGRLLGFKAIWPEEVDEQVRTSSQFDRKIHKRSTLMCLDLEDEAARPTT